MDAARDGEKERGRQTGGRERERKGSQGKKPDHHIERETHMSLRIPTPSPR